eukprot:182828-Rhodomonas_salina.1
MVLPGGPAQGQGEAQAWYACPVLTYNMVLSAYGSVDPYRVGSTSTAAVCSIIRIRSATEQCTLERKRSARECPILAYHIA